PAGGHQVILGDRYGRSAAGWVTSEAMKIVRAAGFTVGVNDPFAGGHIVERHGAPGRDVHALQVELDRRCYLGDGKFGFERVAALLHALAEGLGRSLLNRQLPAAAE
ncbi:MAG: N-formylglutamate amidohydrolase, partial [Sphingomicrobium sp.]